MVKVEYPSHQVERQIVEAPCNEHPPRSVKISVHTVYKQTKRSTNIPIPGSDLV